MRVHDLIRDRAFLVTDEYWKRQNELAVNARAGEFRLSSGELKNDVKRVTAEINWNYAVIQRFNPPDLTPHLLPFNLGRAIEGDQADNLPLQANDVITVFSQADLQVPIGEQSKFVRLEGEFKEAGVYEIQRGETLRHLINRVGGFAPQAYLFGSEFTRESTRVNQQERLDQYVNTLDQSVQRNVASAAFVGDPSSAAAAKAQSEADRALVDKMKALKSTGRIVLELKPNATGPNALPDLVLEDGDRMLVPFRPATVNVIGSVYNSGAFIFKPGKSVSDYLRLAGGPTRGSDKGHSFVVRADGSTVSKQQGSLLTGRDFNALRLMPGDTIVVPTKLDRGATLRAFRDWATIFGQLGLAAGGIRTLFP
jgi:protein involved in polysaccharide export with SLBB domain